MRYSSIIKKISVAMIPLIVAFLYLSKHSKNNNVYNIWFVLFVLFFWMSAGVSNYILKNQANNESFEKIFYNFWFYLAVFVGIPHVIYTISIYIFST